MSDGVELYTTLAQVLPLLLLRIPWDRHWLDKLPSRILRTASSPGVIFWTKPRVRLHSFLCGNDPRNRNSALHSCACRTRP
jgi:hypothetical protein